MAYCLGCEYFFECEQVFEYINDDKECEIRKENKKMANCLDCEYFFECEQAIAYINDEKKCKIQEGENENENN